MPGRRQSLPCQTVPTARWQIVLCLLLSGVTGRTTLAWGEAPIVWEKIVLTDRYYCDGVTVGDINQDGHLDIVAGPFWYPGPAFEVGHEFYPAEALPPEVSPSNSMLTFVHDFSGDGWPDILVLGRVHLHPPFWYENPGGERAARDLWEKHSVFERVRGESPTLVDLDGDGIPQLICHWEGAWGWLSPQPDDPYAPWTFHPVGAHDDWPEFYHGTGVGDVNSDGRLDIILYDGWLEQPSDEVGDPGTTTDVSNLKEWTFHRQRFSDDRGGAQMFAVDVNGNGLRDIITALDAHGWGLAWFEQMQDEHGIVSFRRHDIMGDRSREEEFGAAFSQPHALAYADLDGDGQGDIIVGKRMWAHGPTGDVEPMADPVVYWFQWTTDASGEVRFVPHLIDNRSGVGVQIWVADVNGDDRPDVLTTSKLGTFLFLNHPAGDCSELE